MNDDNNDDIAIGSLWRVKNNAPADHDHGRLRRVRELRAVRGLPGSCWVRLGVADSLPSAEAVDLWMLATSFRQMHEPVPEPGTKERPAPIPNDRRPVWDIVIDRMKRRDAVGRERYGTPLQAFNGRDALEDAMDEALDLVVYLQQVIEERKETEPATWLGELRRLCERLGMWIPETTPEDEESPTVAALREVIAWIDRNEDARKQSFEGNESCRK